MQERVPAILDIGALFSFLVRMRRLVPFMAATALMLTIAGITLNFWFRAPTAPFFGTAEELFLEYTAGSNFAHYGFFNRGFLTDYSLDIEPGAPPVFYTHQPPLPGIVVGALISLGMEDLREVRLVMMLFSLAGLVAVMAFFWRHFGPWHGIAVVAFLGINARQVLPWIEHTTFSYWFGLSFVAFWALSRRKEPSRVLWVAAGAFFLISLINYIQLAISLATLGCLWLVRLPNISLRRVLFMAFSSGLGVAVHMVHNLIVLGPSVFFQEVLHTVGNRIYGVPSREAIQAFYQEHNIILFGTNSGDPTISPYRWIFTEYSYFAFPVVISLAGLAVLYYLRRLPPTALALRLIVAFGIGAVSFHVAFPSMGAAYPMPIAVATPIAMAGGLFIGEVISFVRSSRKRILLPAALVTLIVVCLGWFVFIGLVKYRNFTANNVAELEILEEFKGKSFWTNITPQNVGYFTKSWVIGQMALDSVKKRDASRAYVAAVNRTSPTWSKVNDPDYFFFSLHNVVLNTPDRGRLDEHRRYLVENYEVAAWSPLDAMIVDMRRPRDPSLTIIGTQDHDSSKHAKIELTPSQVTVSSVLASGMDESNLVNTGVEGFWHAKNPRVEMPAWVAVDTGGRFPVSLLRLRPRVGLPSQLWDSARGALQTSDDGLVWKTAFVLTLDRASLRDDWVNFPLPAPLESQYLRLAMYDMTFHSMGRIELYRSAGPS